MALSLLASICVCASLTIVSSLSSSLIQRRFKSKGSFLLNSRAVPAYNETEAIEFLQYARVSFCTDKHISEWDCGEMCTATVAGNKSVFESEKWRLKGYVATTGEKGEPLGRRCMVAFRGSFNLHNGLMDALFWMKAWPDWEDANASLCPTCKVHTGVALGYRSLRKKMWDAIEHLKCRYLDFSGHSLGGALVSLASLEARSRQDVHVDRVYTFAKLRVGNRAFVDKYIAAAEIHRSSPPMWRIVGFRDPVPRVPMATLGFVHEPLEVYYGSDSFQTYEVCPQNQDTQFENTTCSYQFPVLSCLGSPGWRHNTYFNLSTMDWGPLYNTCITDVQASSNGSSSLTSF